MFEDLAPAPADPILGLTEAFKADSNSHKVNLGVGVYKDENGKTPVLASVKDAEKRLLEQEATKSYLGIGGMANALRTVPSTEGTINALSISDILSRYPENRFALLLVKVDIEGFERDLFADNLDWIDATPLLVIELHDWMIPGRANSRAAWTAAV